VRLELAKEDADALAKGEAVPVHANVTPSLFVLQGIELEDAMYAHSAFFSRFGYNANTL
jgi:hypothetical protein